MYTYIYIYIFVCVCECVRRRRLTRGAPSPPSPPSPDALCETGPRADPVHLVSAFRPLIEADPLGVHVSAHGAIGGDAVDFFSSPGDPVFYLLHAQIDRLWTIWQGQDWAARQDALHGTGTMLDRVWDFFLFPPTFR